MKGKREYMSALAAVRAIMRAEKCSRREAEALLLHAIKQGELRAFDLETKRPLAPREFPDPEWPQ